MLFSQLKKNFENVGFQIIKGDDIGNNGYYIVINNVTWRYFLIVSHGFFELRQIATPTTSGEITSIYFTRAVRNFNANSLRLYFEGKPIVDIYI